MTSYRLTNPSVCLHFQRDVRNYANPHTKSQLDWYSRCNGAANVAGNSEIFSKQTKKIQFPPNERNSTVMSIELISCEFEIDLKLNTNGIKQI